ncbi:MAG TPA: phosphatase PAP2 family protein [Candidatus Saccharimonadales bacterium]
MHGIVTFIAKYFIVLSVLGAFIVWLRLDKKQKIRFIAVAIGAGIIALILAKLGGHFYYDTRPFVAGHFTPYFSHGADNGFPSDHTLLASFLAFISWKYSRKAGIALLILAIIIGLSRVVAGVHHLTDIIGSIVFALLGVLIASWIEHRIDARHSQRQHPKPQEAPKPES